LVGLQLEIGPSLACFICTKWNGEQLFDELGQVRCNSYNTSNGVYGAHFWLNAGGKFPDAPKDLYSASGYQGQKCLLFLQRYGHC
jgi:hypothetical protein